MLRLDFDFQRAEDRVYKVCVLFGFFYWWDLVTCLKLILGFESYHCCLGSCTVHFEVSFYVQLGHALKI